MNVLGVDRVIIATDELDDATDRFGRLLGIPFGDRLKVATQTDAGEQPVANRLSPSGIEFVTPRSDDGAVADFLERNGPGLYAVSLRVTDLERAVAELDERGVESIGRFESAGVTEAFYHPADFEGAFVILAEYDAPHPMETALE